MSDCSASSASPWRAQIIANNTAYIAEALSLLEACCCAPIFTARILDAAREHLGNYLRGIRVGSRPTEAVTTGRFFV